MTPTVTAVIPVNGTINVTTNNPVITATFSEPMQPLTGTASMTVTCAAPCANATGTATLDATNTIVTFTLTPGTALATLTQYTVTITGITSPCIFCVCALNVLQNSMILTPRWPSAGPTGGDGFAAPAGI